MKRAAKYFAIVITLGVIIAASGLYGYGYYLKQQPTAEYKPNLLIEWWEDTSD